MQRDTPWRIAVEVGMKIFSPLFAYFYLRTYHNPGFEWRLSAPVTKVEWNRLTLQDHKETRIYFSAIFFDSHYPLPTRAHHIQRNDPTSASEILDYLPLLEQNSERASIHSNFLYFHVAESRSVWHCGAHELDFASLLSNQEPYAFTKCLSFS